ncbi:BPI fold-containing family B member 3 [Notamacropus eugenii]|uniref:BPI fold-containing family B member 3 n=1 Tax=Notamacropus eugenii TaxID=9315 RepID=UPI003B683DB7
MFSILSVVLFFGLLTPSQELLETVGTIARIDKDELASAVQNSLVGGPILQNVLGTVTSLNQGLLGSGGLLGGGGLLGFGGIVGAVQQVSGLKIEELTLPKVSLNLLPGFGVRLNLLTKVGLHGSGPLGSLLQLSAEVNVSSKLALGISPRGTPILIVKSCDTLLGHISLLSGLLPTPLFGVVEQTLFQVLPRLLCPIVESILVVVNELLSAVLGLVPLGALGTVEFTLATLPIISNQYIQLDFNPVVKSVSGNLIDFPEPRKPIKLPPKEDHTSQVTVPSYLFNTVFALLQTNGALDLDITPELVPSRVPMTTTALAGLLPTALGTLPPNHPLMITLRVREVPAFVLKSGKASLPLPVTMEVFVYHPHGIPDSLFSLNSVLTLSAHLATSATKLHVSLSLERLSAKLASSYSANFDVSHLEEWLSDVLRATYLPKLNVHLDGGIPLPKILNVNFANAALEIIDNAVLLTVASRG